MDSFENENTEADEKAAGSPRDGQEDGESSPEHALGPQAQNEQSDHLEHSEIIEPDALTDPSEKKGFLKNILGKFSRKKPDPDEDDDSGTQSRSIDLNSLSGINQIEGEIDTKTEVTMVSDHIQSPEVTASRSIEDSGIHNIPRSVAVRVMSGPAEGKFYFIKEKSVLGRDIGDIVIHDPLVSSKHLELGFSDGIFTLVDLDSANGTFINGARIQPGRKIILTPDDELRVGSTVMKLIFYLEDPRGKEDFTHSLDFTKTVMTTKSQSLASASAHEVSVTVPMILRIFGNICELTLSFSLGTYLFIFLAQNAGNSSEILGKSYWDFITALIPAGFSNESFGQSLLILLFCISIVFASFRIVPICIIGRSLGGLILGYYPCSNTGKKLSRGKIIAFEIIHLIFNVPTAGLITLIPSFFHYSGRGITDLILGTRMGMKRKLAPMQFGNRFAIGFLITFMFGMTPYFAQFFSPLLMAKPENLSLKAPKIKDLKPGFEYFPIYDLMIALPLASEDWNVFPELIYRPRSKKQFLEKIAFYFSKKGNPAMNKITFKGRRIPQEKLFPWWSFFQMLDGDSKKEVKNLFFSDPALLGVNSRASKGLVPFSELFGQAWRAEVIKKSGGKSTNPKFVPAGLKWIDNTKAEMLMILYVPEKKGELSPLEYRVTEGDFNFEGGFGKPWIEVIKMYKDMPPGLGLSQSFIPGHDLRTREVEIRMVWQDGFESRNENFLVEMLSSAFVAKEISSSESFINFRLQVMQDYIGRGLFSIPMSLLISKLSLSPNDLKAYLLFAEVNKNFIDKVKSSGQKSALLSIAKNNILSSMKYLENLNSNSPEAARVREIYSSVK